MSEFLYMGGYATYVWSSYGIALVVLLANIGAHGLARRKLLHQLARRDSPAPRTKRTHPPAGPP